MSFAKNLKSKGGLLRVVFLKEVLDSPVLESPSGVINIAYSRLL